MTLPTDQHDLFGVPVNAVHASDDEIIATAKREREDALAASQEVEFWKNRFEGLEKKLQNKLAEALAEVEASKGRIARDAARQLKEKQKEIVVGFLPIIDDMDRAVGAVSCVESYLGEGIRLTRDNLLSYLEGFGLKRIEDQVWKRFDPICHEAVDMEHTIETTLWGTIATEHAPGYLIDQYVVRPAKVRVFGKYPEEKEPEEVIELSPEDHELATTFPEGLSAGPGWLKIPIPEKK